MQHMHATGFERSHMNLQVHDALGIPLLTPEEIEEMTPEDIADFYAMHALYHCYHGDYVDIGASSADYIGDYHGDYADIAPTPFLLTDEEINALSPEQFQDLYGDYIGTHYEDGHNIEVEHYPAVPAMEEHPAGGDDTGAVFVEQEV